MFYLESKVKTFVNLKLYIELIVLICILNLPFLKLL